MRQLAAFHLFEETIAFLGMDKDRVNRRFSATVEFFEGLTPLRANKPRIFFRDFPQYINGIVQIRERRANFDFGYAVRCSFAGKPVSFCGSIHDGFAVLTQKPLASQGLPIRRKLSSFAQYLGTRSRGVLGIMVPKGLL